MLCVELKDMIDHPIDDDEVVDEVQGEVAVESVGVVIEVVDLHRGAQDAKSQDAAGQR